MRRFLRWLGLVILTMSFVWFALLPRPEEPTAQPRRPASRGEGPLVVVLDPGHGGKDSGAMCGTVMEKDLTLDVALRAEILLRAAGFATVLTRTDDRYLSLAERAELGNDEKNSLFVSIHFNDGERAAATGVETFFAARQAAPRPLLFSWLPFWQQAESPALAARSENLAHFIQAALVERTQAVNRGIKSQQFYVIANVRHPAALLEGGFLTNEADMTKLATSEYRQQIALAIGDGVHRYREAARQGEATLALATTRAE